MKSKIKSLYDQFFIALKDVGNIDHKKDHFTSIYRQLFSMQNFEEFVEYLDYLYMLYRGEDTYFKEAGKTDWFYLFHKSVRQTDFFKGCYKKEKVNLLTEDEVKRFRFLTNKVREKGYKKAGENGQLFNDEYKDYLELHGRFRRETQEVSITGHLDGILWGVIHVDNGTLEMVFKTAFEYYEN